MPHARRDNSERPGNVNAPTPISICARRDKSAGAPHFFAALTSFPEVHFDRDQDQGRKAANRRKRRSTSPRGIAIFAQPMPSSGRREVRQTSGPANHSGRARAADADLSNSLQNKQFPSNRRRPQGAPDSIGGVGVPDRLSRAIRWPMPFPARRNHFEEPTKPP